ncbi:Predicted thioesterase [Cupriavidus sp. YR651]|uniref:thioesterase family protein n=1 Tax=Cupriavidus sp. YR651 TaxID=1855315 RepID=UPI00087E3321|nr:hotdog domain-containing protein [Cupriavidus sp. YR651]SDC73088.1 Predicted thioesterase [Cupriavidus sp. YR651]
MENDIKVGATCTRTLVVDRARTIDFLGEDLRIYATPELVRDIEQVCLDFLQDHVTPGQSSVGTEVSVEHAGATPLGGEVRIEAEVTAADGRSVTFRVAARDAVETVCTGIHRRFVVDVERLKSRVRKKVEAAATTAASPALR